MTRLLLVAAAVVAVLAGCGRGMSGCGVAILPQSRRIETVTR